MRRKRRQRKKPRRMNGSGKLSSLVCGINPSHCRHSFTPPDFMKMQETQVYSFIHILGFYSPPTLPSCGLSSSTKKNVLEAQKITLGLLK